MGRRSEQRIAVSLPVIVRGFDSGGLSFRANAETVDISFSGVSLVGLRGMVSPGTKVEIESQGGQKSWYRIQWTGEPGSFREGLIGARCLDQGKYIWGVAPKEWEPDTYDHLSQPRALAGPAPAVSGVGSWMGRERRQFARHPCRIEAHVITEGDSIGAPAKVTDISIGGCYVEMLSPSPVDTPIQLSLDLEGSVVRVGGLVRASQAGFGMGVAFSEMSPESFEKLRRFAPPATPGAQKTSEAMKPVAQAAVQQAAARPPVPAAAPTVPPQAKPAAVNGGSAPRAASQADLADIPATAEAFQALIRLVLQKGLLTRAELTQEIERLKAAKKPS